MSGTCMLGLNAFLLLSGLCTTTLVNKMMHSIICFISSGALLIERPADIEEGIQM